MSEPRAASRRGRWIAAAALAAIAGIFGWRLFGTTGAAQTPSQSAAEGVPVTVTRVTRQDVPVLLSGIGNVQALYSVLLRARVDGTLESVGFTEGQMVKKGQLLVLIDPRPYQAALDQAIGQLAHDQAALAQAQTDLRRYQTLLRQDSISKQQAEDQRFQVLQYQGSIQTDQANINTAKLNLIYCHIESPIDGRVGLRLVDPGNMVRSTDTNGLVTVTQVQPITAVFTLPETDLPQVLAARRRGPVKVFAYAPDSNVRLATGVLLTPDNTVSVASGTIKLKAQFANADNSLWPGQYIEGRVQIRVERNAVTLPADAVQRGQDTLYVYVVKPDQTVALRPVSELMEQDGTAVITKGLQPGEEVVLNGQSRLADGVRIAAHTAAAASPQPRQGG